MFGQPERRTYRTPRHHDNQLCRVRRDRFACEDDDVGISARRRFYLCQSTLDIAPHCIAPKAARGTPVTTNRAVAISPGYAAHHAAQRVGQSLCLAPAIKTWRTLPAACSSSSRRRSSLASIRSGSAIPDATPSGNAGLTVLLFSTRQRSEVTPVVDYSLLQREFLSIVNRVIKNPKDGIPARAPGRYGFAFVGEKPAKRIERH